MSKTDTCNFCRAIRVMTLNYKTMEWHCDECDKPCGSYYKNTAHLK